MPNATTTKSSLFRRGNSKTMDEKKSDSALDTLDTSLPGDEEDEEEDRRILNMSLIKSVLGSTRDLDAEKPKQSSSSNNRVTWEGADMSSVASIADDDKNRDELVTKIGKLTAKVTQAEIDKSAEKAMRKKKEKSLVKLAKELNKRAADQVEKEKAINTFKSLVADLEARLHATRSEMDERIISSEKKAKEYNQQLDDAHSKYRSVVAEHDFKQAELVKNHVEDTETMRQQMKESQIECERLRTQIAQVREHLEQKTADLAKAIDGKEILSAETQKKYKKVVKEHESRVSDMNKKHAEQMDAMRKQLLASNLDGDKIRTQLASLQMQAAPGDADEIVKQTMRSATFIGDRKEKTDTIKLPIMIALAVVALSVIIGFFTLPNVMCAPVRPGTSLVDGQDMVKAAMAPWWAPGSQKAFESVCGGPQTTLKWMEGKLIVENAVTGDVLLTRKSNAATVNSDSINFFDKKGKIESLRAPWSK